MMILSKERFKKSSEDGRRETDAHRWRRRRRLYFRCQNSSDTDVSDSIGDSANHEREQEGFLNASKFDAQDEMASFNLFMPNAFKTTKKSHTKKVDDSALGKLASSIMPSVAEGTKPWMQFCKNAQKALTVLNDEVSTALRDSFCSIDNIQIRIRRTMDEIRECDKMYEHLRLRQRTKTSPVSHSEPHLKIAEAMQLRSETQMRIGPLPSIAESIYETEPNQDTEVNDVVSEVERRVNREREAERRVVIEAEQPTIVAEELFVPEKVNKIASTNLNNLPSDVLKSKKKSCQFLYREKTKRTRIVKVAEEESPKFADTVLFAKRDRKHDEFVMESWPQTHHVKQPMAVQSNFKSGLNCFDILDEITLNDLKPLSSEYPRKDNVGAPPPVQKPQTFYLHKLVYDATQDEFLRLLRTEEREKIPPKVIDFPKMEVKKTEIKSASNVKKKPVSSDIITSSKTKQKRSKKNAHDEIVSRLKPYIFDPHIRYPTTTITVMPAMITTYTNPNFVKNVKKAVAERNQVGDHTSKPVLNKRISSPRGRPKLVKMRGDDNETNHHESFPALAAFKEKYSKQTKNATWESNIQNVIEMIETKIVEILADPGKAHLEAFKSVENKILEILNSDNDESIGEPDSVKRVQRRRSKTTDNFKNVRQRKNDLRSKTEVALLKNRPSSHYPLTRAECHKKLEPNKKQRSTEFLDSVTDAPAPKKPSRHAIEKIFYQRPLKLAQYVRHPLVYYQTSSYGMCSKKLVTQKPPSTQILTTTAPRPKLAGPEIKKPTPTRIVYVDIEPIFYNKMLNYLYATLFAIIFFGLTFNYACQ